MEKPTLAEVKRKFREWKRNNKGEAVMVPRRLKREAVHLLDVYSKATLAKELGLNETCIRAWQRRILEIEHDAGIDSGIDPRTNEGTYKRDAKDPTFFELTGDGKSGVPLDAARPSLLLRRPDGSVLTVKGDLTARQLKALTRAFLGGTP